MNRKNLEQGSTNPLLISSILLGILAAGFAGGFIWAYSNYVDHRDNTQAKVDVAVSKAKKEQAEEDEKILAERIKEPYSSIASPDELGRVTFNYPRTWSAYVPRDGKDGTQYEAYLSPNAVPAVSNAQPYATRLIISDKAYEASVKTFDGLVKKGDLRSSPVSINGFTGIRLDGKFSATRTGSAVLFKVRDKTLLIACDADAFKNDFDTIVLQSLQFNP